MSVGTAPLRLEEIDTAGAWLPLELEAGFDAGYSEVTAWPGGPAVGWNIVAGRLGLTRGGRALPPGGVLLDIGVTSHAPPPADRRWEYRTSTRVEPHRSGRPALAATVALRAASGAALVAEVRFTLLWPRER